MMSGIFFLHLYFSILTAQLGDALFAAENASAFTSSCPHAGDPPADCRDWAYFIVGSYGMGQFSDMDSHLGSGMVGIANQIADDMMLGLALGAAKSEDDLDPLGSSSEMTTGGGALLASYAPGSTGPRLFGAAHVADLDLRETRRYDDGFGLESSHGKANGIAYGAALRAGWAFAPSPVNSVIPYADIRWSTANIGSFEESGGSAPADYSGQRMVSSELRLGIEDRLAFSDSLTLEGRIAWGRRLDDGRNRFPDNGSSLTEDAGLDAGNQDWVEVAAGASWRVTDRLGLQGRVTTHSGDTGLPAVSATLGATMNF